MSPDLNWAHSLKKKRLDQRGAEPVPIHTKVTTKQKQELRE